MRNLIFALLLAAPAAAFAQQPPRTVEVQLSSFAFAPETLHLTAGERVTLHLVNSGRGGHNFAAPEFFAAAADVSGPVTAGKVELGSHASVDVTLTPTAGHYRLRCTHTMHTAMGMSGEIVVE
ncbi:MAG TPA: cupredoxin domain-containing protein [Allosphingosinicella sp.]|nr:cupredoxin domain-containing protein [Allosphingosinicella sp.]